MISGIIFVFGILELSCGASILHSSILPPPLPRPVCADLELTGLPNGVVVVKVLIFMSGQSMMVAYLDEVFSIHEVVF